jgi:uridylate kinase
MVLEAQKNNLITDFASDLIGNGVALLQYVDGTIFCIKHDLEHELMYMFEMMSGLKINYMKSEVVVIGGGGGNHVMKSYSEMFNCQVDKLPMKYLGVSVTISNLNNIDWDFLDAKMI